MTARIRAGRVLVRSALLFALLSCLSARVCALDLYAMPSEWIDEFGHALHLSKYRGSVSVVSMAYGACRKICSTTLRRMEQIQDLADARGLKLQFILVSLDPTTDTPQAWREYRAMRHLERDNWTFLSGTQSGTRAVADRLGVNYWFYDDHVLHDFGIVLVSESGEILRKLTWQDQRLEEFVPAASHGR